MLPCQPVGVQGKHLPPHCLLNSAAPRNEITHTNRTYMDQKAFPKPERANYCQNVEMLCKEMPTGLILVGSKSSSKSFSWRMIRVLSVLCIKLMAVASRITYETKCGTIATGCRSQQGRKCQYAAPTILTWEILQQIRLLLYAKWKTKCACQMWAPDWLLCTTVTWI